MTRKEQEALLALFNSYRPSKRVTTIGQLSDGKVLVEVMHSIDETHFKGAPKTPNKRLSTGAGGQDDWVLRMNTLKRLYRLLLSYPINTPNASTLAASSLSEPDFNSIARNPQGAQGTAGLLQICRFCVAAGSMGSANERVIAKIQALDEGVMVELMKSIESIMTTLPQIEGDTVEDDADTIPSATLKERDRLLRANEALRAQCEQLTGQVAKLQATEEQLEPPNIDTVKRRAVPTEADGLRAELARAEDGLAETEAALEKQTALVAELEKTVEDLRKTALEAAKLREQVDELRQVEDRLQKSENVNEKYKRKLEESAGLRRELRSLQDEHAALIEKSTLLESRIQAHDSNTSENKHREHIEVLRKRGDEQVSQIAELNKQIEDAHGALVSVESERDSMRDEIQVLQARIRELENAPKRSSAYIADQSLDVELAADSDTEDDGPSKAELRARVQELEKQLANGPSIDQTERVGELEQLLAETKHNFHRVQQEHIEMEEQHHLVQARLERIMSGRDGDDSGSEVSRLAQEVRELKGELARLRERDQRQPAQTRNLTMDRINMPSPTISIEESSAAVTDQNTAPEQGMKLKPSLTSPTMLELQLMQAAWHDMGSRILHNHIGAAGLRRPAVPRPTATSWLARRRRVQDDALFAR